MRQAALVSGIDSDPFGASDVVPFRLGDALIARITQAIHDGRLKPGDALPSEARIATSFGVSKPIAREAIRQLAAMGVVHIQQGKPTRVQALDAATLDRFFRFAVRGSKTGLTEAVELRRVLEPPIARYSAERRSSADIERLAAILVRMEAALTDVPRWIEADLDFHEAIAASAGNRLLDLQIRALRPVIRRSWSCSTRAAPAPRPTGARPINATSGRGRDPRRRCRGGGAGHEQAFRSG